jgi:hypothetical protein
MFSANSSQVSNDKLFVEDVFSTYLYTGNSGTQTITNGIDLAGKGGLVWLKNRGSALSHILIDTVQGCTFAGGKNLISNNTNGAGTVAANTFRFDSTGFSFGSAAAGGAINGSGETYASWTFRKAPKFFDVVTFTVGGTTVFNHSLGSIPGFVIIKATGMVDPWYAVHRGANGISQLNSGAGNTSTSFPGIGTSGALMNCTATTFDVSNFVSAGQTYVAYLFAHDATADGIIQCGSYVQDNSTYVDLGWEPQFVIYKRADGAGDWFMVDNMRGFVGNGLTSSRYVWANFADAESNAATNMNATGFLKGGPSAGTYIYIAIRRGPMRTPTLGTSVFAPVARAGTGTGTDVLSGFVTDLSFIKTTSSVQNWVVEDRLRGGGRYMSSNLTNAEAYAGAYPGGTTYYDTSNGIKIGSDSWVNGSSINYANYFFRRAPGFFDEVCYTGNGVNGRTVSHNLGVTPELIIMKNRTSAGYNWFTWDKSADLSQASALLALSNSAGRPAFSSGNLNSTVPTSTVFTVGGDSTVSGQTYVAYLFASCPGVSKVGSYTGNGSSQTINCDFAAGARFVLIKRTDSTGDWYVWDTARGIVAGNDPHLSLNTTAAEVTTDDTIDTNSSGFVVNQVAATNVNVSSATYIFLAIA